MTHKPPSTTPNNSREKSARIILFAQALSVAASVTGFIGLIIAYRALRTTGENETRIPTIS